MERRLKGAKIETNIWATIAVAFGTVALVLLSAECDDIIAQLLAFESAVASMAMSAVTGRIAFCNQRRVEFIETLLKERKHSNKKLHIR